MTTELRQSLGSQAIFILFLMWDGMVARISWLRKKSLWLDTYLSDTILSYNDSCSLQPLAGKLYTYFSSKVGSDYLNPLLIRRCANNLSQYTFLSFLALFELGSLLCGVATSSNMLIIGRAVAGTGSSGLMNGALTIIAACVPLERRPRWLPTQVQSRAQLIASHSQLWHCNVW